jgi:hypothetical protein
LTAAAATANTVSAIQFGLQTGIFLSRLTIIFRKFRKSRERWQASVYSARRNDQRLDDAGVTGSAIRVV